MNASAKILPLPTQRPSRPVASIRQRFKVTEFTNPRTGSKSWRVSGTKRDGARIRENYFNAQDARHRQVGLEAEFLARSSEETTLRATRLSEAQVRIAEAVFPRLEADDELFAAVEYWQKHGRAHSVAESPRLDDAVEAFNQWLEGTSSLRPHSKRNLRIRVSIFGNSVPNLRVADITPETIETFLDKRNAGASTKDNDRRAISRFLSWCIERPRRWLALNPCAAVKVEKSEKQPPAILTVDECKRLLLEAEKNGLAPYIAVCLFGGLRPFEASRLTWPAVNLRDKEIRLEANQTKTGTARVVAICDTLLAWLKAHKGEAIFPANWRRRFDAVKKSAGLNSWPVDVMRHTAISHYFRKTGSYGQTAEQFGNSEAVIKAHYQGRVSSEDTRKFYALTPRKENNR